MSFEYVCITRLMEKVHLVVSKILWPPITHFSWYLFILKVIFFQLTIQVIFSEVERSIIESQFKWYSLKNIHGFEIYCPSFLRA